jgi:hypothetical protein
VHRISPVGTRRGAVSQSSSPSSFRRYSTTRTQIDLGMASAETFDAIECKAFANRNRLAPANPRLLVRAAGRDVEHVLGARTGSDSGA